MIDMHTHTLLSDGVLLPSELVARAGACGYRAVAVTDHADRSNINDVVKKTIEFAESMNRTGTVIVVAGVELTHIPPSDIGPMVEEARGLGAGLVVFHGETIVEPVAKGTNLAAIEAGVDILAHPGLVTEAECRLAARNNVRFEITSRKGHGLTNGYVALMAKRFGVKLVLNTDAHGPSDLITEDHALKVVRGAGLDEDDYEVMRKNAEELLEKVRA